MEMVHKNQQRVSSNINDVNAIQQFTLFRRANTRVQQSNRNTLHRKANGLCQNCGQNWSSKHPQVCPALGSKCSHSGLPNYFALHVEKKKNIHKIIERSKRVNKFEKSETTDQSDIQNVRFINCNE